MVEITNGDRRAGRVEPTTDNLNYRGPVRSEIEGVDTIRFSQNRRNSAGKLIQQNPTAILALDPGGTLGWSLLVLSKPLTLNADVFDLLDTRHAWWHGQLATKGEENAAMQQVCRLIKRCPRASVVSEGFVLRTQVRGEEPLSPVRQSAVIKHYCWLADRNYFEQDPSFKATANDAKLRNWRVYNKFGAGQHARDADRHAIMFLRRAVSNLELLLKITSQ